MRNYKGFRQGDTVQIISDESNHKFMIGQSVKIVSTFNWCVQVIDTTTNKCAFVNNTDIAHIRKVCSCPKCNVGLVAVDGDIKFVSSHSHYKKKCSYKHTKYDDDATKLIIHAIKYEDAISSRELETLLGMHIKTIRNIIGVLIKSKVVEIADKDICTITGRYVNTYKLC